MSWFKVDDDLHDHPKARKAGKPAMGLWVLAGSWAASTFDANGFVPRSVVTRWGTVADAQALARVGLWHAGEHDGERGWWFHDWQHYQPPPEVIAKRRAERSDAGSRGAHQRWHVKQRIVKDDCEYCVPGLAEPPDDGNSHSGSHPDDGNSHSKSDGYSMPRNPYPLKEEDADASSSSEAAEPLTDAEPAKAVAAAPRDDVERICTHLADRVEGNGSKRPTITAKWRTEARLLLDKDGRTEEQVHAAIDWCQNDGFWRANVLAMPKLRAKYDQLRLAAQRSTAARPGSGAAVDWDAAAQRAREREARDHAERGEPT